MAELEKVLNGLRTCSNENGSICELDGVSCPYYYNPDCIELLARDALNLLTETIPHVMALDELRQAKDKWVWMEYRQHYYGIPHKAEPQYHTNFPGYGIHYFRDRESRVESSYNIEWRCWNLEPTSKQIEAEIWNTNDND